MSRPTLIAGTSPRWMIRLWDELGRGDRSVGMREVIDRSMQAPMASHSSGPLSVSWQSGTEEWIQVLPASFTRKIPVCNDSRERMTLATALALDSLPQRLVEAAKKGRPWKRRFPAVASRSQTYQLRFPELEIRVIAGR
ncbi:MAG: hypothetical protein QOE90_405 [Thermoplasmata archaeon]|nr:hypothetical protein [Thermoplasmata archaeon]